MDSAYGIIPPGLEVTFKNLLRQDVDRLLLFESMTAALKYLDSQSVVNKTYYKIVGLNMTIVSLE